VVRHTNILILKHKRRRELPDRRKKFSEKTLLASETTEESCQIGTSERSENRCPRLPYHANAHPSYNDGSSFSCCYFVGVCKQRGLDFFGVVFRNSTLGKITLK